jgi:hypothetical protein
LKRKLDDPNLQTARDVDRKVRTQQPSEASTDQFGSVATGVSQHCARNLVLAIPAGKVGFAEPLRERGEDAHRDLLRHPETDPQEISQVNEHEREGMARSTEPLSLDRQEISKRALVVGADRVVDGEIVGPR